MASHAQADLHPHKAVWLEKTGGLRVDSSGGSGISELISAISAARPEPEATPLEGLVQEGDLIVLVTPIDLAAPKGRLILPQVETLRDALDRDCAALVVKERELFQFYRNLKTPPKLVITDSQAFNKVAADIPEDQLLTSFSILFARKKGDLDRYVDGLNALESMRPGAKVLILESCSHHLQADDIGTVKIPRLFRQMVRRDGEFTFARKMPGRVELAEYDLVIMCASCMLTRGKVMSRLDDIREAGVPVLNYGLFLAWANGLFPPGPGADSGLDDRRVKKVVNHSFPPLCQVEKHGFRCVFRVALLNVLKYPVVLINSVNLKNVYVLSDFQHIPPGYPSPDQAELRTHIR